MIPYADRLEAALVRAGNPCLVGLDPHPASLPREFAAVREPSASREDRAAAAAEFLIGVLDVVADRVPAVKPQSALFEAFGAPGAIAWERVVRAARDRGLVVIGDVKRGDIDSTARAYAQAYPRRGVRAATRSPSTRISAPTRCGRSSTRASRTAPACTCSCALRTRLEGVPGARLAASLRARRRHGRDARRRDRRRVRSLEHRRRRRRDASRRAHEPARALAADSVPDPGYGAQGAGAKDVAGGFLARGRGALVNSSRGILFAAQQPAYAGLAWKDATSRALDAMIAEIVAASGFAR
jgi:orotidine-5'-phosphate decarboxylase